MKIKRSLPSRNSSGPSFEMTVVLSLALFFFRLPAWAQESGATDTGLVTLYAQDFSAIWDGKSGTYEFRFSDTGDTPPPVKFRTVLNPTRLVFDLPGRKLVRDEIIQVPGDHDCVSRIRSGQHDEYARVVLDLRNEVIVEASTSPFGQTFVVKLSLRPLLVKEHLQESPESARVRTDASLTPDWIVFEPSDRPVQKVSITNKGDSFVTLTSKILKVVEHRLGFAREEETSSVVVTPRQLRVEPFSTGTFRVLYNGVRSPGEEQVFKIIFMEAANSGKEGEGYLPDLYVAVPGSDTQSNVTSTVDGGNVVISNTGNRSIGLASCSLCVEGEAGCSSLESRILFAGELWKVPVRGSGSVRCAASQGSGLSALNQVYKLSGNS